MVDERWRSKGGSEKMDGAEKEKMQTAGGMRREGW